MVYCRLYGGPMRRVYRKSRGRRSSRLKWLVALSATAAVAAVAWNGGCDGNTPTPPPVVPPTTPPKPPPVPQATGGDAAPTGDDSVISYAPQPAPAATTGRQAR